MFRESSQVKSVEAGGGICGRRRHREIHDLLNQLRAYKQMVIYGSNMKPTFGNR